MNLPGAIEMDWTPHPEGGAFREVFRSVDSVTRRDHFRRSALTHIEFRLEVGEVSQFHRVNADEVWNLYVGAVRLWLWNGGNARPVSIELSVGAARFCGVVPSGWWQAAEPIGGPTHVGCSVAPGFEFEDFVMIGGLPELQSRLTGLAPGLRHLCGLDGVDRKCP